MISAIRYVVTLAIATAWYGLSVLFAALFRVRQVPGGVYDHAPHGWGEFLIRTNRLEVQVKGLEKLVPGQPYVFASNHLSFVDIWALAATIPGPLRFVVKKELRRAPILGPALQAGKHIFIDRQHAKSAIGAYDEAVAIIRSGISAVVFVEGTRSRDGKLQDFKKAPFVLPIVAQVPVVPVAVNGTFQVLPPGKLAIRRLPITVSFGDPIPTTGMTEHDRAKLAADTRVVVAKMLEEGGKEGRGE